MSLAKGARIEVQDTMRVENIPSNTAAHFGRQVEILMGALAGGRRRLCFQASLENCYSRGGAKAGSFRAFSIQARR